MSGKLKRLKAESGKKLQFNPDFFGLLAPRRVDAEKYRHPHWLLARLPQNYDI